MTRIRSMRWLLVATACLAMSCKKGAGGGGGAALSGATGSALDVLPKETSLVFGFSATKFRDTAFYKMLTDAIPPESQKRLQEIKETCKIDPLTDLDSIVVGGGGNLDKSRMLIIVKGNWTEDKVTQCLTAMGPKVGKKLTAAKEGKVATYTVEGQQPLHVGWVNDLMVLSPAAMDGDKAFLTDLLKQKSSVKDNQAMMDLVKKCDTSATVWGAALATEGSPVATMLGRMTGGAEKPAGAWLTVKMGKALDASAGMRMASDADAKAVTERVDKELAAAKQDPNAGAYLKTAAVTQSGSDVTLKIELTEQQMQQLTEMAKQMAPMLQMMMGGGG